MNENEKESHVEASKNDQQTSKQEETQQQPQQPSPIAFDEAAEKAIYAQVETKIVMGTLIFFFLTLLIHYYLFPPYSLLSFFSFFS
jgi:hypothetical protein